MTDKTKNSASSPLELENEKLRRELEALKQIIRDNDMEVESLDITMSDEEWICVDQIAKLKIVSENGMLEEKEVRMLDLLNKNLRLIRGQTEKGGNKLKKKMPDKGKLLEIARGGK